MTELAFDAADGERLGGTLEIPCDANAALPAVLLLSGSGPLDRDSNTAGQGVDSSRELADALKAQGVVSYRYDKRGIGISTGDYPSTGFDDETADAVAAFAWLRNRPEVDAGLVGVIGQSVGATIAIRVAATAASPPAFVVLLAAAARSGREVMERQSATIGASLPGPSWLTGAGFRRYQAFNRRRIDRAEGDVLQAFGKDHPARWLREYMAYDPTGDLGRFTSPVLAITGGKDLQVDPGDLERLAGLLGGVSEISSPPNLTHLLRSVDGPPSVLGYREQFARRVDDRLLRTVLEWVAAVGVSARRCD